MGQQVFREPYLRWFIPSWMEFMPLNMHVYLSAILLAAWEIRASWRWVAHRISPILVMAFDQSFVEITK